MNVDSEYGCFEYPTTVGDTMKWQGKDLKDYTKEELMLIVETLARMAEQQARRHVQDLESLLRPQEG